MRAALAQINTTVGDFKGNLTLIKEGIRTAQENGADIVAFPELAVCGYPPEDLVLSKSFITDNLTTIKQVANESKNIVSVVGFIDKLEYGVANAAAIISCGNIEAVYYKVLLPNYGVFDEKRYFTSGNQCPVFNYNDTSVGVSICEDIWQAEGPVEAHRIFGTQVLININASPYEIDKQCKRINLLKKLAIRNRAFIVYVNQVGGQDELVFEGGSSVTAPDSTVITELPMFKEQIGFVDLNISLIGKNRYSNNTSTTLPCRAKQIKVSLPDTLQRSKPPLPVTESVKFSKQAQIYSALVVGTRDYIRKTGFHSVAIALSGGVDSALTACIAVDAIGRENVLCIAMPSRYSSQGSLIDAKALTDNLGVELWTIPIDTVHSAFEDTLKSTFENTQQDTTEENIQSRIRGTIIMAISNKFKRLVLTTGNKSEMATGYATLYGDMAGGFAVIKDILKTSVYKLCEYRNSLQAKPLIPTSILTKPPSAELRPDQKDQDSLPPYEILDKILVAYIEQGVPKNKIVENKEYLSDATIDINAIEKLLYMVDINEHKRRQAPPGVKITSLAFGRDRRLPIATRYTKV